METSFTEGAYAGEFLIYEEDCGGFSREQITLKQGNNLGPGAVLAKIVTAGTATATAVAGNTGNGTIGAITVGANAQPGTYVLEITAAAANGGSFVLRDPAGDVVAQGTVGVAFSGGGLSFTLSDGVVDFARGDSYAIAVSALAIKRTQLAPAATDGSQIASEILYGALDATSVDMPGIAVSRHAIVNANLLVWPAGITAAQKDVAISQLKEGPKIIVR